MHLVTMYLPPCAACGCAWIALAAYVNHTRWHRRGSAAIFYANVAIAGLLSYWAAGYGIGDYNVAWRLCVYCALEGPAIRRLVLLWWCAACASAVAVCSLYYEPQAEQSQSHKRTVGKAPAAVRKYFHVAGALIAAAGLRHDPQLAYTASALMACAFVVLECGRALRVNTLSYSERLSVALRPLLDERQESLDGVVATPVLLLCGVFAPLWVGGPVRTAALVRLEHYAGVAAVGAGDTLAALVGRQFGTHRWPAIFGAAARQRHKTFEGSVACAAGTLAVLLAVAGALRMHLTASTLAYLALVSSVSALVESQLSVGDNVVLPLVVYAMLRFM